MLHFFEKNKSVFFVPTFEENRIFLLGLVFLFSHFLPIERIVLNKNILYPNEDIDFLSSH